jgi:hypothetical protein
LAPHLPGQMARLLAGRMTHAQEEERQAEEFADRERRRTADGGACAETARTSQHAPPVLRVCAPG